MAAHTEALTVAYGDLADIVQGLDNDAARLPTGCAGWAVRDLLTHLLFDAQRGIVAMATPAEGPADRNAVTYWADFSTPAPDPESHQTRQLRTVAAAWPFRDLVDTYAETTRAAVVLAERTPPDTLVATQGHVLCVADLISTLVVEAAIHHLDLPASSGFKGPGELPLALVRHTLDGLLGHPSPAAWDDASWARLATGRRPLSAVESALLGTDAERLPLLS